MPAELSIRRATPADARTIGEIHVAAHRFAYRGIAPDRYLASLDAAVRADEWSAYLLTPPESLRVWLIDRDGIPVGFCGTHAVTDEATIELPVHTGELHWIHLLQEHVGAGVGRVLMTHAVADLAARGFRLAVLWVLEGNARARRFYASGGWAPDGTTRRRSFRVDDVETPVVELRYARRLAADGDAGGEKA